jgi:hypothetical protein
MLNGLVYLLNLARTWRWFVLLTCFVASLALLLLKRKSPAITIHTDSFSDGVLRVDGLHYGARDSTDRLRLEGAVKATLGSRIEKEGNADCLIVSAPESKAIDACSAFIALVGNGVSSARWQDAASGKTVTLDVLADKLKDNFAPVIKALGDAAYLYRDTTWSIAGQKSCAWLHITNMQVEALGKIGTLANTDSLSVQQDLYRWIVVIEPNSSAGNAIRWLSALQSKVGKDNVLTIFASEKSASSTMP